MSARFRLISAAVLASAATSAIAAPQLHPLISDNAVLQRGQPLRIYGTAAPNERLSVSFAGTTRTVRATKGGQWIAEFPVQEAGGPYEVQVQGAGGATAIANNVKIGDVWLCSGQSNMEWHLAAAMGGQFAAAQANDPDLRITTIEKKTSISPEISFTATLKWDVVTPKTVPDFSAACYYMGRDLRASQKVPIGLVDATWGGTPIRAWMSDSELRQAGGGDMVDLVAAFRRDPIAANRRLGETFGDWWRQQSGDAAGQEPWKASSRLQWQPVPKYAFFSEWGPEWNGYVGGVWLRKTVALTAEEAARNATLSLGVLDDQDQAFVNGTGVGSTNDWGAERNYPIGPGILRAGENEIVVFVRNGWGPGGIGGPAEKLKLSFAGAGEKSLSDGWQYAKIDSKIGGPPSAPWAGPNGAATIYNAMIAPMGPFAFKGAAWYQGESDVDVPGYDKRLAGLYNTWRQQFRNPTLPFLIVGLAGYGTPRSTPAESGWAAVVNEQRAGVQADKHAAFIPAIDLGEPEDIHPLNKAEVGRRLALAARTVAYSDAEGKLAPLPLRAQRSSDGVTVSFTKTLQALSGGRPTGFELCGDTQASCRFADARIDGSSVVVAQDGQPATRVRYAWADYPIVNLYDTDLLPASSFELPISQ